MDKFTPWVVPIQENDTVWMGQPLATLWDRWYSTHPQVYRTLAVINGGRQLVGIIRPGDVLAQLLRFGTEIYHTWSYTHVEYSRELWSEKLKSFGNIPVGRLASRPRESIAYESLKTWYQTLQMLSKQSDAILWVVDDREVLTGKVTLGSLSEAYQYFSKSHTATNLETWS